jgi:uncharacterized membrane protein YeiH
MFDTWIVFLEFFGILSFAFSGIVEARREDFDLVGTFFVAVITAFGGGTLRDLLIARYPIFWIQNDWYLIVILGLTYICCRRKSSELPKSIASGATLFDAAGTGLFGVVGTSYTISAGYGIIAALMLGCITATFGGVFRDIICNRLPYVFQRTELSATCAILAGASYLIANHILFLPEQPSLVVGASIGGVLRWQAVKRNIQFPI